MTFEELCPPAMCEAPQKAEDERFKCLAGLEDYLKHEGYAVTRHEDDYDFALKVDLKLYEVYAGPPILSYYTSVKHHRVVAYVKGLIGEPNFIGAMYLDEVIMVKLIEILAQEKSYGSLEDNREP